MVTRMETRAPKMIEKLVRVLTPPADREHVLGDLSERYVSPRQYLFDALRTLPYLIGSRARRTTHPLGLVLIGLFLWFATFYGNRQASWLGATIPTVITLALLTLRDVYRRASLKWAVALLDTVVAAAGVLLSQAILAVAAPELGLDRFTLTGGFPLGFIILFFIRLQSPTGFLRAPTFPTPVSIEGLRAEIGIYERLIRRAVNIEIGACVFVTAVFTLMALSQRSPPVVRVACVLTVAAAIFVWVFLYRNGRVRPISATLGLAETITVYRADLIRRRRLSQTYVWWYVAPLAVGPSIMAVAIQLRRPDPFQGVVVTLLFLGVIGVMLVLGQLGVAHKTQQRIEQLTAASEQLAR